MLSATGSDVSQLLQKLGAVQRFAPASLPSVVCLVEAMSLKLYTVNVLKVNGKRKKQRYAACKGRALSFRQILSVVFHVAQGWTIIRRRTVLLRKWSR